MLNRGKQVGANYLQPLRSVETILSAVPVYGKNNMTSIYGNIFDNIVLQKYCVSNLPRRGVETDTRTAAEIELDNTVKYIQSALSPDLEEIARSPTQRAEVTSALSSRRSVPLENVPVLSEEELQMQKKDPDSAVLGDIAGKSWMIIKSFCRNWNQEDRISPAVK